MSQDKSMSLSREYIMEKCDMILYGNEWTIILDIITGDLT